MYLRAKKRIKDGKEHRYWSIVESCRNLDGRVVQRQVLYLGEINDSQKTAWCRTIEVLQVDSSAKQMALFPADRPAPELECEVVQVKLNELRLHHPRQWGACWFVPRSKVLLDGLGSAFRSTRLLATSTRFVVRAPPTNIYRKR